MPELPVASGTWKLGLALLANSLHMTAPLDRARKYHSAEERMAAKKLRDRMHSKDFTRHERRAREIREAKEEAARREVQRAERSKKV